MLAFLNDHAALIFGFAASGLTGLFAYWKSTKSDDKARDEFLFGSLNKVVEVIQSDNASLRKRIVELEARIQQLEDRITSLLTTVKGVST